MKNIQFIEFQVNENEVGFSTGVNIARNVVKRLKFDSDSQHISRSGLIRRNADLSKIIKNLQPKSKSKSKEKQKSKRTTNSLTKSQLKRRNEKLTITNKKTSEKGFEKVQKSKESPESSMKPQSRKKQKILATRDNDVLGSILRGMDAMKSSRKSSNLVNNSANMPNEKRSAEVE